MTCFFSAKRFMVLHCSLPEIHDDNMPLEGQVWRIIIDGAFGAREEDFFKTASLILPNGSRVHKKRWYCGHRFDLDDGLSLQLCFNGGNLRSDYFNEVVIPKMETYLGTIVIVDSDKQWYMWHHLKNTASVIEETCRLMSRKWPILVASNNDSLPTSMEINELKGYLQSLMELVKIPIELEVVACNTNDPESCKYVLLAFLQNVLNYMDDNQAI